MNVVEALHSILIHSSFQPPWYYLLGKKKKKKIQTKKRVLQSSDFAGGKEVSGKVGGIRGVCEEEKKQIGLQELNSEIAEVTDTENTQQQ